MWDLVPWSGIEPGPPALREQSLSPWTTRADLLFSLKKGRCIKNCSFSSLPVGGIRRFFSSIHCENPSRGKTHKGAAASLWLDPPGILGLNLSTLSLQQLVNYSSGFPAPALVPMESSALGCCDSLCLFACLFLQCRVSGLPWDLSSLTSLRRVDPFPLCLAFYLLRWSCDF